MKNFEFDVEVRVRKTLRLGLADNADEASAKALMERMLQSGDIELSTFQKWAPAGGTYPPVPVEKAIDNAPSIVAVRIVGEE